MDEETPQALPNLDFKIMQGNSLLEQYKGVDLSAMTERKLDSTGMYSFFEDMIDVYRRELREMLAEYYDCTDHNAKQSLRTRIIDNVKQQLQEQHVNVDFGDLDLSGTDQFFLWHTWFHDVFSNGGFDIVIGNPPYVQVKKGTVSVDRFPYSEGKDKGKQNLYKLFVEHSYNLSNLNGICCLITQSSLMCDISAQYTRELLLKNTTISHIIEFPKVAPHKEGQLFKDALVATCITLFRKEKANSNHTFKLSAWNDLTTLDKFDFAEIQQSLPISFYPNGYCFPLIRRQDFSIIKKMNTDTVFLDCYIKKSSQGDFNLTNESFCFSTHITDVKMYRGCHIHRCYIDKEVEEYIQNEYKKNIINENESKTFLVCQQISGMTDNMRFNMALSINERCLFGNSVNKLELIETINPRFILAIINSTIMDWYFRKTSTNNHVNIYELEQLPIPKATTEQQKHIIAFVEDIMQQKKSNPNADISSLESEIDRLVYQLYGLTEEEIAVIERS